MLEGLSADSEEKREPVGDIDAVGVDSLKALDPEWPIREADSTRTSLWAVHVIPVSVLERLIDEQHILRAMRSSLRASS
jgi:hypothetical protein